MERPDPAARVVDSRPDALRHHRAGRYRRTFARLPGRPTRRRHAGRATQSDAKRRQEFDGLRAVVVLVLAAIGYAVAVYFTGN